MYSKVKPVAKVSQPVGYSVPERGNTLIQAFWIFVAVLLIWAIFNLKTSSLDSIIGAALISFAALLPSYLWCSGKALGMPLFPLFALTYLWTYAIQLVNNNPEVVAYSPSSQLLAGVTVAGFLGLGTFIWFQFVNSAPRPPKYYRAFSSQEAEPFFLFSLATGILFIMNSLGGWFALEGGVFALIRGVLLAFNALGIFILAYHWGNRKLSKNKSRAFLILLILYAITNAASLLLVVAVSGFLLAIVAFTISRRQVPLLPIILVVVCFMFLHSGKSEMRSNHWADNEATYVQPWQYPDLYAEWIGYSLKHSNKSPDPEEGEQSGLERSSLIHLLLMAQDKTPRDVPYLFGASYAIIPQLLVPRFMNSTKIRSHEGTYLLNIHYGLQTREEAYKTTIGWGLLNEAYANFGLLGCVGLAVILGAGYGQATRWRMNTPLLSSRSLFTVLLISYASQSEYSAGVYVAALFQSVVPLVVVSLLFMKVYKTE